MITIVSGLPRSGTSLMMQMLAAGGMPILSDGERRADVDNPRGYLEWERIKQLPKDPGCIAEAEGKAVKVISQLLLSLPAQHEYRVIFMQRPLPEVMASQDEMLRRRGNFDPGEDNSVVARAFQDHLSDVYGWLNGKPHVKGKPGFSAALYTHKRFYAGNILCKTRSLQRTSMTIFCSAVLFRF